MRPEVRRAWRAVLSTLQLSAAIGLYLVLDTWLKPLFTSVPELGASVSAVLSALVTLGGTSLVLPVSNISVQWSNVATRAAVAGPKIEVAANEFEVQVARYDIEVRYEHLGMLGRAIVRWATAYGMTLELAIDRQLLVTHVVNGAGAESNDGVKIALNGTPSEGTWQWSSLSFDSKALPGQLTADVSVRLHYSASWRLPIFKLLIWPHTSINGIHLAKRVP